MVLRENSKPNVGHAVFSRLTIDEVKMMTAEAKAMLDTWQDTYMEVRAKIESSGRDARWEFDKRRLFERTGYMAQICQNLQDIAQVGLVLIRPNSKNC